MPVEIWLDQLLSWFVKYHGCYEWTLKSDFLNFDLKALSHFYRSFSKVFLQKRGQEVSIRVVV